MNVTNQLEQIENTKSQAKLRPPFTAVILLIGIIFISVNLRAPLTSVGPLVDTIRGDLQISNTMAGMITTLPLLAFAFYSMFVPKLAQRFGMEKILFFSIIILTVGIMFRSISGIAYLYIGTAILGLGIAACNVLLPSIIKQEYPERIGLMTGIYSVSMNLTGAIASGVSVPIAIGLGFGWQGALGVWGILSFLAILFWLPQVIKRSSPKPIVHQQQTDQRQMWRSPLAWQVTLFMGLQSMIFYVFITWLPEILKGQGFSLDQAGWYLSIMQMAVLPVTFIAPILAGRMFTQRPLVMITCSSLFIGTLGLLYGSMNFIGLWVVLLGMGSGFSFSLAMIFFSLRTKTAKQAAELSGMAQSVGYLLAAIGPTLFGFLNDMTESSTIPLLLLAGVTIVLLWVGLGAGNNRVVHSKE